MSYCEEILERFTGTLEWDKARYAPPWMVSWAYQDKRDRRGLKYPNENPQDFYSFGGPQDLLRWFNFQADSVKPDYFPEDLMAPLVELSRTCDEGILRQHGLFFDTGKFSEHVCRYNAQDFLLQNFYPVPVRFAIQRVLDFGAGYGRQANLWFQKRPDVVFVGMDAIPLSYCLQHLYYSSLSRDLRDYVISSSGFAIGGAGLYHLPTWRTDLLATSYFDMVICVQVLQELSPRLLEHMLTVFQRVLKPGGALYIRDHEHWGAGHHRNVAYLLSRLGFVLEFKPHVQDRRDVHGIPRLWRKPDPEVQASQKAGRRHRLLGLYQDLLASFRAG